MDGIVKKVLESYLGEQCIDGKTSQDIADDLRDTLHMEVNDITALLLAKGYRLRRDDDRLVWSDQPETFRELMKE